MSEPVVNRPYETASMLAASTGEPAPPATAELQPCPHGDDESHDGLGKAWCDAEMQFRERAERVRAYLAERDNQ